jgi:hypothetical protein
MAGSSSRSPTQVQTLAQKPASTPVSLQLRVQLVANERDGSARPAFGAPAATARRPPARWRCPAPLHRKRHSSLANTQSLFI